MRHGLVKRALNIHFNREEDQPKLHPFMDVGALAGSGYLGRAAYRDFKAPLDVGVTWGSHPSLGAGHVEPGQAVKGVLSRLQKDRSLPAFNLHTLVNDSVNPMSKEDMGRRYDLMVSAGHGIDEHRKSLTPGRPMWQKPRVSLGGYAAIQNDLGGPGYGFESILSNRKNNIGQWIASHLGHKDTLMTWGPDWHKEVGEPYGWWWAKNKLGLGSKVQDMYMGGGIPTMPDDVRHGLADIQGKSFSQVVDDILRDPSIDRGIKDNLSRIRDKKVMVITGGGTGALVSTRARLLAEEAAKNGISPNDIHFLGLQGNARRLSAAAHAPINDAYATLIDRLPRKYFAALAGTADTHWSGPGASQIAESMASPNRTLFSESVKDLAKHEMDFINKLKADPAYADKGSHGWMSYLKQTNSPNRLGRMEATSLPGIDHVNTIEDALKKFMSSEGAEQAGRRAKSILGLHNEAAVNMENALRRMITRQHAYRNFRGAAKGLGSAALAVTPLFDLIASRNKKPMITFS